MKFLLSIACSLLIGGLVQASPKDNSKAAFEQRIDELTGGKTPVVISLFGWADYIYDKDFHHGNIYSISPYALMSYLLFISERMNDEYSCYYIDDYQITKAPYNEGFSNNRYKQKCARLDSSATFLTAKKPHFILLKGENESESIEFTRQDDGGYSSNNAPYWDDFVMKWAYKFRGTHQELPESLSTQLNKGWSDIIKEKSLFGKERQCLSPEGLVSYMRISCNIPCNQGKSIYRFYQMKGTPIYITGFDDNRFLHHATKDLIGEDANLISFFRMHRITLVVEEFSDSYYLYELQTDGTYYMKNAPHWDSFIQEYGIDPNFHVN